MTSPNATGLESVSCTFVPFIKTEVTVRVTEFTRTVKAEVAGIIFARLELYVISTTEGAAFSTTELT